MRSYQIAKIAPQTGTASPWEVWRHENIDAEDAATLSGENPWETRGDLLARKAQPTPARKPITPAMQRGRELRPKALKAYRDHTGIPTLKPCNLEMTEEPTLIAHPDLFSFNPIHIAEIHTGISALNNAHTYGRLPKPYWAEAQHTLMVTGLKFLYVFLFSNDPKLIHKTFTVNAAPAFQKDLQQECVKFLTERDTARKELELAKITETEIEALKATIAAIRGNGPRVPYETFRRFVPTLLKSNGQPTPQGHTLLAAA